jgi:mono/diheme cytochrome c family protein
MGRGWRPILVGAAVAAGTFTLAQAQVFEPDAPAASSVSGGDVERGEIVFERSCAGCHGSGGEGGGIGPRLVAAGIDAAAVSAAVQQGRGVMPAGLVSGGAEADVVAYVVSISTS